MTTPHQPPEPRDYPALDVVVVGGCGHVGLPLAVALASRGSRVGIYDIDGDAVDRVNKGEPLFREDGLEELLQPALRDGMLAASSDPAMISGASTVIVVVGTPVDEHLNPDLGAVPRAIERVRGAPARRPADRAAQHGLPRRDRADRAAAGRKGLTSTWRSARSGSPRAGR